MIVQAEISVYPLGTESIGETVNTFINSMSRSKLNISRGTMSTNFSGEASDIFSALNSAFVQIADNNAVVLVLKVSNACPLRDITLPGNNTHHSIK
jgi:uncharacterized protein YqgV (UPF0045/DUF77 family)